MLVAKLFHLAERFVQELTETSTDIEAQIQQMQKGTKSSSLISNMEKATSFLSQSGSDMYELSNSLELGDQDYLGTKKRNRQQRGADGKFESLMKESDFGASTFNISSSQKQIQPASFGLSKLAMKGRQDQTMKRDKLNSRTRQTGGYANIGSSSIVLMNKRRQGQRGPVASEFFGQGNIGETEVDGLKGSQEYFGSSYDIDMKQESMNAEEMFQSPVKL